MTLQRLAFAFLLLTTLSAFGQTRFISDDIPIELRAGPSLEYRILRYLSAGVRLEALETNEDESYTHVRLGDDTDGWVLSRYLIEEPIARDRLAAAERNLAAAQTRAEELEAQVAALTEELTTARGRLDSMQSTNSEVTTELQDIRRASANAIALRDQNEELRLRLGEADQRINRLTMDNTELQSDSRQRWFMVGGGVLFGGFLIGLIAPSFKRRRRSDW